ncbi:MAG: hypothetical protein AAFR67_02960, partial [Chloroflexota bacterium]
PELVPTVNPKPCYNRRHTHKATGVFTMTFLPRLIIHGGAWDWDDALDAPKTASLHKALSIGNTKLSHEKGHSEDEKK